MAGTLPAAHLAAAKAAARRLRARVASALPGVGKLDKTTAGLAAGLALASLVAGWALLRNADLKRALRRRDRELNQLILMARPPDECCGDMQGSVAPHGCGVTPKCCPVAQIINLQERMVGAAARSRVPIVRHACSTSVASFCHPDIVPFTSF